MKKLFTILAAFFLCMSVDAATFTKVTTAPSSWDGEYVIAVPTTDGYALAWTGVDAAYCRDSIALNADGKLESADVITVTVAAMADGVGYSMMVNGGANDSTYLSSGTSAPGYSNGLKFIANPTRVDFALESDGSVAMSQTIEGKGVMYILFNKTSSNERYRFYKDTNYGNANYPCPCLYKKDSAEEPVDSNLFHKSTATLTTYFGNADWSAETASTGTYDAATGKVTANIAQDKDGQWKAQVKLQNDFTAYDPTKVYTFSCKLQSNNALPGVTFKLDDAAGIIFDDQAINLAAGVEYSYENDNFGVAGANGVIVFDLGHATAGTTVEIWDIVLTEGEPAPTYYLIGDGALFGSWNLNDAKSMPNSKISLNLGKGNYEFKVLANNTSWDNQLNATAVNHDCSSDHVRGTDNIHVSVASSTTMTVKVVDNTLCITGAFEPNDVVGVYSVVGDSALTGSNWDLNDANNEMSAYGAAYRLVKDSVHLTAGSYKWKVVGDHSWTVQYPTSGDYILTIPADGDYKVVFTLDPEAATPGSATATVLGAPFDHGLYVPGVAALQSTWFATTGWSEETNSTATVSATTGDITINIVDAKADMWQAQVFVNTGIAWEQGKQYHYECVIESTGKIGGITFKINDSDTDFYLTEAVYDVNIGGGTYGYATDQVSVNAAVNPARGDLIFGFGWIDAGTTITIKDIRIVAIGDVVEQKMYIKHPWGTGADADWTWQEMSATKYNSAFDAWTYTGAWGGVGFNVADNAEGTDAKWFAAADIAFRSSDDKVLEAPALGTECEFIYVPALEGGIIPAAYVIYTPASVESVEVTGAQKIIENGHVYILRNGVRYTVTGARVD